MPMYNESASVDSTLRQALESLGRNFVDFEIIVVDDGSTDNSAAHVTRWTKKDPRVVLIRMPRNERFGGALREGLAAATKCLVFYTDFDLPVPPDFFPEVVKELNDADIVTGYSLEFSKNLGWKSKLLSNGYNFLVSAVSSLALRDVNFGFKAMRRSTLHKLTLTSRSPFVDAEMLIQAQQSGQRIRELAVPFVRRQFGVSRIRRLDVIAWTLFDILRWRFAAVRWRLAESADR